MSIWAPHRVVSEMYDEAARAVDDNDRGREVMARWALVVPWYTEYY